MGFCSLFLYVYFPYRWLWMPLLGLADKGTRLSFHLGVNTRSQEGDSKPTLQGCSTQKIFTDGAQRMMVWQIFLVPKQNIFRRNRTSNFELDLSHTGDPTPHLVPWATDPGQVSPGTARVTADGLMALLYPDNTDNSAFDVQFSVQYITWAVLTVSPNRLGVSRFCPTRG